MGYKHLIFPENSIFLVTGGAGFIGSNLCEALLEMGYIVRCLDDLSTGKQAHTDMFAGYKNYTFLKGDIRDFSVCLEASRGADYVLHQAAWGSVPRSIELPLLYEEINIRGTLNMLEASRQNGVRKFVYASSSAVYGDNPELPKREGVEGKVLSPYAFTKRANEEYSALYTELYGVETIGLRYFNVFGRRQDPEGAYAAVIPRFIKCLLNDEAPTIFGDGLQSRDFTYVENVIEANLKACLASSEYAGQTFNIATGGQETLLTMYETLCKLLGKDITPIFAPDRKGDIKHSNADISKARKAFGYAPKYNFDDGIKLCVDWYRNTLG